MRSLIAATLAVLASGMMASAGVPSGTSPQKTIAVRVPGAQDVAPAEIIRTTLTSTSEQLAPSLAGVTITNNSGNGYAGLSFNESGGYVPPDTCGAAGPSNYVETVNQTIAIYSPKTTGALAHTDSLAHFFFDPTVGGLPRASASSVLSDPITVYNELISRFIVGDQDVDFTNHVSNFVIAVSKTSNPTTLTIADWVFYYISTTETGFDADYPGNFGYNADAFVFTLNMFPVSVGSVHVLVTSVNSADLAAGVSQASLHNYKNDLSDFSVRPTTMHGSVTGDPMWLVTEHGDDVSIDVIKMTNVLSTSPTFTTTNLAVNAYSEVVPPLNPNGTIITSNIDSRILKSAEANNTIVATHAVSVSATQDVARWYTINVSSGVPALSGQGQVSAGNNTYLTYPAIDISSSSGNIGMTYMRSGTDTATDYMSMYITGRAPSDPAGTMETPVLVPAGTGHANYSDFSPTGRAGDLSGINIDPVDGSFWAANEFANTEANANWGTAIANFTIGAPVPFDFNGDGHPDYLLLNPNTRQTAIWYMNNATFLSSAYGPTLPAPWTLKGAFDFNGDGHPDYALFNSATRQTAIWYLSGSTFIGSAYGPTLPAGWALVATADFNGNGKPDYVLYNAGTRQTAIWFLNNNVFVSGAFGPTLPAGWVLRGVADFNGDGHPDYALFNPGTRQTAIWYLSGSTFIGGAFGPTLPAGWALVATADFNGNGKPDYVLYNASTRQTAIWYLNNNIFVSGAFGPTIPPGWSLVAP